MEEALRLVRTAVGPCVRTYVLTYVHAPRLAPPSDAVQKRQNKRSKETTTGACDRLYSLYS